jgi:hypothetical protein
MWGNGVKPRHYIQAPLPGFIISFLVFFLNHCYLFRFNDILRGEEQRPT